MLLWALVHSVAWTIIRIPGFLLGFCMTIALGIAVVFLGIYFFVLGPPRQDTTAAEENVEAEGDRDQLLTERSSSKRGNGSLSHSFMIIPSTDSLEQTRTTGEPDESEALFQCGWIYVTSEYECPPKTNISSFSASQDNRHRSPPRFVLFGVLKESSLGLFAGESQVCSPTD